jgi:hypothetical protein
MVELCAISFGEYEGNDFNDLISEAKGTVEKKRTSLEALASGFNMLSSLAFKEFVLISSSPAHRFFTFPLGHIFLFCGS